MRCNSRWGVAKNRTSSGKAGVAAREAADHTGRFATSKNRAVAVFFFWRQRVRELFGPPQTREVFDDFRWATIFDVRAKALVVIAFCWMLTGGNKTSRSRIIVAPLSYVTGKRTCVRAYAGWFLSESCSW